MWSALECAALNVKTNLVDLYYDCCIPTYGPPYIFHASIDALGRSS